MHAQCALYTNTHSHAHIIVGRVVNHRQNNGAPTGQNFVFDNLVLARDYCCWQYTAIAIVIVIIHPIVYSYPNQFILKRIIYAEFSRYCGELWIVHILFSPHSAIEKRKTFVSIVRGLQKLNGVKSVKTSTNKRTETRKAETVFHFFLFFLRCDSER